MSQDDLENIKSRIRYDFLMGLDTPENVTSSLARMVALNGDLESVDQFYKTLESVTPEDVRAAAEYYLQNDRRTTLILKEKQNDAE